MSLKRLPLSVNSKRNVLISIFMVSLQLWCCALVVRWPWETLFESWSENNFNHFRINKYLEHYLNKIFTLVEPYKTPCSEVDGNKVVVIVGSSPKNFLQRNTIRKTWGDYFPTYFFMGVDKTKRHDQLVTNFLEAERFDDIVIFDFIDHYHNQTIKTALMLRWAMFKCQKIQFVFKVDDSVFINREVFNQILDDFYDESFINYGGIPHFKLIGNVEKNTEVSRNENDKRYVPLWLFSNNTIPEYLTGPGYLIKCKYLRNILYTANGIPMHNLEDVFFTYNVAYRTLGYKLTHVKNWNDIYIKPNNS